MLFFAQSSLEARNIIVSQVSDSELFINVSGVKGGTLGLAMKSKINFLELAKHFPEPVLKKKEIIPKDKPLQVVIDDVIVMATDLPEGMELYSYSGPRNNAKSNFLPRQQRG